jgi:transaldolase
VLQAHLAAKSGATYVSPFVHRTQLAGGGDMARVGGHAINGAPTLGDANLAYVGGIDK